LRICRLLEAANAQFQFVANLAGDPKMEPLEKLAVLVLADRQLCGGSFYFVDFDISAIEP